jgi:hypothetical protein
MPFFMPPDIARQHDWPFPRARSGALPSHPKATGNVALWHFLAIRFGRVLRSKRPVDGGKKYKITFPKGELPPAGAFWSVTNYQDHFLVLNNANKYAVSSWMNPKIASDGSLTIYLQPTGPGSDLEINWLPSSPSIPGVTPLMRLYWPLPPALKGGTWSSPAAVEVT